MSWQCNQQHEQKIIQATNSKDEADDSDSVMDPNAFTFSNDDDPPNTCTLTQKHDHQTQFLTDSLTQKHDDNVQNHRSFSFRPTLLYNIRHLLNQKVYFPVQNIDILTFQIHSYLLLRDLHIFKNVYTRKHIN